MSLADLLAVSPRELFHTLVAVLFGTYLSTQVFRPSLPRATRPTRPALPSVPVSLPTLFLDPPSLISGFTAPISTYNGSTSLLHVPPRSDDIQFPKVELIVYLVMLLAFYATILLVLAVYASPTSSAHTDPTVSPVAQLYETLTGWPYASAYWEHVLSDPTASLNWATNAPDPLSLPDAPHTTPPPDTKPRTYEEPTYAAYLDAPRIDAFAAHLAHLGYTDLRIWAFDITPPNTPFGHSAVTIDFRFTARAATLELVTRSVLRFVFPRDVPRGRTDFMLWDLGAGCVRAFEVREAELVVFPVDVHAEQEQENRECFEVLPFALADEEEMLPEEGFPEALVRVADPMSRDYHPVPGSATSAGFAATRCLATPDWLRDVLRVRTRATRTRRLLTAAQEPSSLLLTAQEQLSPASRPRLLLTAPDDRAPEPSEPRPRRAAWSEMEKRTRISAVKVFGVPAAVTAIEPPSQHAPRAVSARSDVGRVTWASKESAVTLLESRPSLDVSPNSVIATRAVRERLLARPVLLKSPREYLRVYTRREEVEGHDVFIGPALPQCEA